jgi:hypothetical protein
MLKSSSFWKGEKYSNAWICHAWILIEVDQGVKGNGLLSGAVHGPFRKDTEYTMAVSVRILAQI